MAPFEDVDLDGVYNPQNGDYPKMKGDEAVFYILNDVKDLHTSSGGYSLGVELHIMVYAYNSIIEAVNNTVFTNYKIYNRSANDYSSFKIGAYTDLDVGFYAGQDFVGCDTNRNMYYGYTTNIINDTLGEPAQGVKFLNKTMNRFSYSISSSGNLGDPNNGIPTQFYNYLSSTWRDGSPLYYGGNGYYGNIGVSSVETSYAFPSNPSQTGGWSQNDEGDMRGIGVIEENNFNSGDVICFDLAYIFNLDKSVDNIGNVNQLLAASDDVQDYYDNNQLGCDYLFTSVEEKANKTIDPLIYPNPFSDKATITFNRRVVNGELGLYNSLGQKMRDYKINHQDHIEIQREVLKSGIYFFTLIEESMIVSKGKLIIE